MNLMRFSGACFRSSSDLRAVAFLFDSFKLIEPLKGGGLRSARSTLKLDLKCLGTVFLSIAFFTRMSPAALVPRNDIGAGYGMVPDDDDRARTWATWAS